MSKRLFRDVLVPRCHSSRLVLSFALIPLLALLGCGDPGTKTHQFSTGDTDQQAIHTDSPELSSNGSSVDRKNLVPPDGSGAVGMAGAVEGDDLRNRIDILAHGLQDAAPEGKYEILMELWRVAADFAALSGEVPDNVFIALDLAAGDGG